MMILRLIVVIFSCVVSSDELSEEYKNDINMKVSSFLKDNSIESLPVHSSRVQKKSDCENGPDEIIYEHEYKILYEIFFSK